MNGYVVCALRNTMGRYMCSAQLFVLIYATIASGVLAGSLHHSEVPPIDLNPVYSSEVRSTPEQVRHSDQRLLLQETLLPEESHLVEERRQPRPNSPVHQRSENVLQRNSSYARADPLLEKQTRSEVDNEAEDDVPDERSLNNRGTSSYQEKHQLSEKDQFLTPVKHNKPQSYKPVHKPNPYEYNGHVGVAQAKPQTRPTPPSGPAYSTPQGNYGIPLNRPQVQQRVKAYEPCTYKSEKYQHGDSVPTPEPCLNCTCQKGILMCFLRVCPSLASIPNGCFTAREEGQCCPTVICSDDPETRAANSDKFGGANEFDYGYDDYDYAENDTFSDSSLPKTSSTTSSIPTTNNSNTTTTTPGGTTMTVEDATAPENATTTSTTTETILQNKTETTSATTPLPTTVIVTTENTESTTSSMQNNDITTVFSNVPSSTSTDTTTSAINNNEINVNDLQALSTESVTVNEIEAEDVTTENLNIGQTTLTKTDIPSNTVTQEIIEKIPTTVPATLNDENKSTTENDIGKTTTVAIELIDELLTDVPKQFPTELIRGQYQTTTTTTDSSSSEYSTERTTTITNPTTETNPEVTSISTSVATSVSFEDGPIVTEPHIVTHSDSTVSTDAEIKTDTITETPTSPTISSTSTESTETSSSDEQNATTNTINMIATEATTIINETSSETVNVLEPLIKARFEDSPIIVSSSPAPFDIDVDLEDFNAIAGACMDDETGALYAEGSAMLSGSKHCHYCYCIRGKRQCVKPKCGITLHGCKARYTNTQDCCPNHYDCPQNETTTTPVVTSSTERSIIVPIQGCSKRGKIYRVGEQIATDHPCEVCYCTPSGPTCRRLECPIINAECQAVIAEGHCCPTEYICNKTAIESATTYPDYFEGYKNPNLLRRVDEEEPYPEPTYQSPNAPELVTTQNTTNATVDSETNPTTEKQQTTQIPTYMKSTTISKIQNNTNATHIISAESLSENITNEFNEIPTEKPSENKVHYVPQVAGHDGGNSDSKDIGNKLKRDNDSNSVFEITPPPSTIDELKPMPLESMEFSDLMDKLFFTSSRADNDNPMSDLPDPVYQPIQTPMHIVKNETTVKLEKYDENIKPQYDSGNVYIGKVEKTTMTSTTKFQISETTIDTNNVPTEKTTYFTTLPPTKDNHTMTTIDYPDRIAEGSSTTPVISKPPVTTPSSQKRTQDKAFTVNLGSHITVSYGDENDHITPTAKYSPMLTTTTETARTTVDLSKDDILEKSPSTTTTKTAKSVQQSTQYTTIPTIIIRSPINILKSTEELKKAGLTTTFKTADGSTEIPYIITSTDVVNNEHRFSHPTSKSAGETNVITKNDASINDLLASARKNQAGQKGEENIARFRDFSNNDQEMGRKLDSTKPVQKPKPTNEPELITAPEINFSRGIIAQYQDDKSGKVKLFSTVFLDGSNSRQTSKTTKQPTIDIGEWSPLGSRSEVKQENKQPIEAPTKHKDSAQTDSSIIDTINVRGGVNHREVSTKDDSGGFKPVVPVHRRGQLPISIPHTHETHYQQNDPPKYIPFTNPQVHRSHDISQIAQTPKENTGNCLIGGTMYTNGEAIKKDDVCQMCRCYFGEELCQRQTCPPPPATHCITEDVPGYCCPRYTCHPSTVTFKPDIQQRADNSIQSRIQFQDGFHQINHPNYIPHTDVILAPRQPPPYIPFQEFKLTAARPPTNKQKVNSQRPPVLPPFPPNFFNQPPPVVTTETPKPTASSSGFNLADIPFLRPFFLRATTTTTTEPQVHTLSSSSHTLAPPVFHQQPQQQHQQHSQQHQHSQQQHSQQQYSQQQHSQQQHQQHSPPVIQTVSYTPLPYRTESPTFSPQSTTITLPREPETIMPPLQHQYNQHPPNSIQQQLQRDPPLKPLAPVHYQHQTSPSVSTTPPTAPTPTAKTTIPSDNSIWSVLKVSGCNIYGKFYNVNEVVTELTERCKVCTCTAIGVHCIQTCRR